MKDDNDALKERLATIYHRHGTRRYRIRMLSTAIIVLSIVLVIVSVLARFILNGGLL